MSNCPLCGSSALIMFVSVSCSNQDCQNADPNYIPELKFEIGKKVEFIIDSEDADWSGFDEFAAKKSAMSPDWVSSLTFEPDHMMDATLIEMEDDKWGAIQSWSNLWFPLSAAKPAE